MDLEHFFSGTAMSAVDTKGRVSVPAFLRAVIERRSAAKTVFITLNALEDSLVGFDESYVRFQYQENERLRLRDEAAGADPRAAAQRNRRAFAGEPVPYDSSGRMVLPPMMRKKGQIVDWALFYSIGATFEIWNPLVALKSDDEMLRDVAAWHLEEKGVAL